MRHKWTFTSANLNSSVINRIWSVADVALREVRSIAVSVNAGRRFRQPLVVRLINAIDEADAVLCQQSSWRLVSRVVEKLFKLYVQSTTEYDAE